VEATAYPEDRWPLLLAPLVPLAMIGVAATGHSPAAILGVGLAGAVLIGALLFAARLDPAWIFSVAIGLTVFSGNWRQLGFPSLTSPDRLLLLLGIVVLLARDPAEGRRPFARLTPTHGVLLLGGCFALCSALAAGTLFETNTISLLFDRFGIVPFVLFFVGPIVYYGEHQRRILLGTMLVVGTYLGLVSVFQTLGPHALVFPRYIVELNQKIQAGRARGPFGDAAANGVALFDCVVMAAISLTTFRHRGVRIWAYAICAVCILGLFLTEERSIWIGSVVATLVVAAMAPRLRRPLLGVVGGVAVALALALILVPGLQAQTSERLADHHTEWDRLNLNTAAENMVKARPLLGFGLDTFQANSQEYFQQAEEFPLTNTGGEVHNVYLSNAAELGLIGLTLWLAAIVLGIGGAIVTRGPPELWAWRIGLAAATVVWLIVDFLVPLRQAFPNQFIWLLAGVVWPWRYALMEPREEEAEPVVVPAPA
jgi:putative inorganic carbon (hco3(-)) transporter